MVLINPSSANEREYDLGKPVSDDGDFSVYGIGYKCFHLSILHFSIYVK